jgi:hypothetical protein
MKACSCGGMNDDCFKCGGNGFVPGLSAGDVFRAGRPRSSSGDSPFQRSSAHKAKPQSAHEKRGSFPKPEPKPKPKKSPPREVAETTHESPAFRCKRCGAALGRDHLVSHMRRHHPEVLPLPKPRSGRGGVKRRRRKAKTASSPKSKKKQIRRKAQSAKSAAGQRNGSESVQSDPLEIIRRAMRDAKSSTERRTIVQKYYGRAQKGAAKCLLCGEVVRRDECALHLDRRCSGASGSINGGISKPLKPKDAATPESREDPTPSLPAGGLRSLLARYGPLR